MERHSPSAIRSPIKGVYAFDAIADVVYIVTAGTAGGREKRGEVGCFTTAATEKREERSPAPSNVEKVAKGEESPEISRMIGLGRGGEWLSVRGAQRRHG